jgi:hypothetical protein
MSYTHDNLSLKDKEGVMELITMCGAGVTLYCSWLAAKDELRCWRRFRSDWRKPESARPKKIQRKLAAVDRADVGAVHWPGLLKGSV